MANRKTLAEVSSEMSAAIDELVPLRVSALNVLASARTMEVLKRCVTYNSRCWEDLMLEAFQHPSDRISVQLYLHLAAVNIYQVIAKLQMYESDLPKLLESEQIRRLGIVRTCELPGERSSLSEIRSHAMRRRALTTCLRAICSEILKIGNRDSQTLDSRLRQLRNCSNASLHFELLCDLVDSFRRCDNDALSQTRSILAFLIAHEKNRVYCKEWTTLYQFALFLLEYHSVI